jgi:hypothetical protein
VLNIALLLAAFVLVLLIVPPVRSFPMIDDWIYKQQVDKLLALQYTPHPWTQASALSHVAWGALFVLLIGPSYTVLSLATLVASGLCLVFFYTLLRVLAVDAHHALFGTTLLGVHPIYFHLSTTFMTDITFLCLVLLACLMFVLAVQKDRDSYLWVGGVVVALALLNRQFAAGIVIVTLAYFWATGRLTLSRALAIAAIPCFTVAIYYVWESGQPMVLTGPMTASDVQARIERPLNWIGGRLTWVLYALSICSLFLLPVFRWVRRPLFAVVIVACMLLAMVAVYSHFGMVAPNMGNIISQSGFGACCDGVNGLWTKGVWGGLLVAGAVSAAFLLTRALRQVTLRWIRGPRPLQDRPAAIVYAGVVAVAVLPAFVTLGMFDRYLLPLVAAFILFDCREAVTRRLSTRERAARWALLVPVLFFTVAAQHDTMQARTIRWSQAQSLVSQGVPRDKILVSIEWGGEYLFDPEGERIRASGNVAEATDLPYYLTDPEYYVSEKAVAGYDVLRTEHYTSWLEFGQTHTILVQKRR